MAMLGLLLRRSATLAVCVAMQCLPRPLPSSAPEPSNVSLPVALRVLCYCVQLSVKCIKAYMQRRFRGSNASLLVPARVHAERKL